MDWAIFLTTIGSAATVIGVIYQVLRNLKLDMGLKFEKMETKIEDIQKNTQNVNIKMAVIESKMENINANVTHLMWHSQTHPHKDANEE